jgi:hypothetical protein
MPAWTPIQTNDVVADSSFSFAVPQGTGSQTFFKFVGQ